jgi:hypothetical protein
MKTTNLIINLDHDEWIMSDHSKDKTLSEIGARKSSLQFVPSLPSIPSSICRPFENQEMQLGLY